MLQEWQQQTGLGQHGLMGLRVDTGCRGDGVGGAHRRVTWAQPIGLDAGEGDAEGDDWELHSGQQEAAPVAAIMHPRWPGWQCKLSGTSVGFTPSSLIDLA